MRSREGAVRRGADPEALHQMRVAVRRMRAAIELLGPALPPEPVDGVRRGLRRAGRALSRVRDLDVLREHFDGYVRDGGNAARRGLGPLRETLEEDHAYARARMLLFLESGRYRALQRALRDLTARTPDGRAGDPGSSEPVMLHAALPGLVHAAFEEVRDRGRNLTSGALDDHHRLRISLKRLRYLLEFFERPLGRPSRVLVERMKKLQDELGSLHDAATACVLLSDVLNEWETRHAERAGGPIPDPTPGAEYLARRYGERHERLARFAATWRTCDLDGWERSLIPAMGGRARPGTGVRSRTR